MKEKMDYKIVTYGNKILRKKAKPVADINDDIRQLAQNMLSTMYQKGGIGLASEQIGRQECVCVIDISGVETVAASDDEKKNSVDMPLVLVNPEIIDTVGKKTEQEGCLSFPGIFVSIERPAGITVRFKNLDNADLTIEADGLLARAIQHEMDHLKGVLLVDRMSVVQKVALAGRLKRLKKGEF